MGRDFYDVVRGIGMWLSKISNNYFINLRSFFCLCGGGRLAREFSGFHEFTEHSLSCLKFMPQAKHGESYRARFSSCKTNHADPTAAGRCSNGNDGVVKIQDFSLTPGLQKLRESSGEQAWKQTCSLWDRPRHIYAIPHPRSPCAGQYSRARQGEQFGARVKTLEQIDKDYSSGGLCPLLPAPGCVIHRDAWRAGSCSQKKFFRAHRL